MSDSRARKKSLRYRIAVLSPIVVFIALLWRGTPGGLDRAESPLPREGGGIRIDDEPATEEDKPPKRAILDTGQEIVGDFRILSFEEVQREGGSVAAMRLAIEKYPRKLEELLASGVLDANMRLHRKDGAWEMPIVKAMRQGTEETFAILMAAGADPNLRNDRGRNGLHHAAYEGLMGAIEIFLAAGADPSNVAYDGSTPLRSAAHGGQAEVVEALLQAGADPEHSALWAAASSGNDDIVSRLASAGARPEGSPSEQERRCPMWHASYGGHLSTVRLLLQLGAQPTCRGTNQPIEVARRQGHAEIVALLESHGVGRKQR